MKNIESPTGINLRPDPPEAVRLSKRAGMIGLAVVALVIGLIGYGIAARRQQTVIAMERSDPRNLTAASDAGRIIAAQIPAGVITGSPQSGGRPEPGLEPPDTRKPPPPQLARRSRSTAPRHTAPSPPPVIRDLRPEEKARAAAYRQELEAMAAPTATRAGFSGIAGFNQLGRPTRDTDIAESAALLQALQRPSGQRGLVELGRAGTAGAQISLSGPGTGEEDYAGQNVQNHREAFLANLRNASTRETYSRSSRVRPLGRYEIKEGWDIPAVLEQELNSDLPGEIRALVRENVYDTATGNYLLVPQGSRLTGLYDSRIAYGQSGLTVVWNRIVFPDGSSIILDGMAGQDAGGRSGLRHDVDNHYRRLLGFAALTSMFSAAFQLSQSRRGGLLAYPSAAETAGSAVGAELSRLGADVTRRNLNIQPTIKVPVGFRFNVRVNRDLLFNAPYRPYRM